MIRFLIKTLYFLMLFFILITGIIVSLISTTPGLETLIDLSRAYIPGTLRIQKVTGSLLNDFTLAALEYEHQGTIIKINRLHVQWHPGSSWRNHQLAVQWDSLRGALNPELPFSSPQGKLTATTTLPDLSLELNTQVNYAAEEHWQMNARLLGALPWQWTFSANLAPMPVMSAKHAGLHAKLSLNGTTTAKNQGNLIFTISPGTYQVPDNSAIPALEFKGGKLRAILSPQKLSGLGSFMIDPNKSLKVAFQLPKFSLEKGISSQQKLNSELRLEINNLDFLQNISPEVEKLKGQLVASLKATGNVGKPKIDSQLLLTKASLYIPKLKLNLDSVDLDVRGKEKGWDANGSIASSGHTLLLKGKGSIDTAYVAELSLEGNDFPLMNTNEYDITISPQLKFHATPNARAISGSVLIPKAQINLQSFSNSISLPDEVIYKQQKSQSTSPITNSSMDIAIKLGENVALNVKGLKGHLDGALTLKQQPQGAINAYGELSVRDGTYKAYGQDLTIKQGQLIFTGGPIDNPGISLRAAKKINNTSNYTNASQLFDFNSSNLQNVSFGDTITLGVEVTGRLMKPQIQLYSEPAIFSQADILSMLVLGRPASQANKAGAQLLLTAISSMNVGGTNSAQLLEQLKQSSGLDFNVQTNTNYNQLTNTVSDSTAFVVGKSLSKRLYLSYNIGLSQTDTNMLTLKYMLNKFFSIQVSTSDTSSAIDFLYTSHKRKYSRTK
ncbi:translocation/assembly module TamB domain-containing protein [Legionella saoudiensis]|uniref:translocation/assembly module TamB domain-containing protein n=1 Tax=Legionella saoudiensis TaxID=1750561 RepID=UPI00073137B6|nr:translocation/assembly module TamB domain-containing protein [Legionella saoudiensis]